MLDEAGSTVCTYSSREWANDAEDDNFKDVRFSTPVVTQTLMIPRAAKNLKSIIWYSRVELKKFAVESKANVAEEEIALREKEEETHKIVHFTESVVTAIWVKPRVTEEVKSDLFYSPKDLERFLMECQKGRPKKVRRVRFTQPLITAVEYVERRTEDELVLCFYSDKELNVFLDELVIDTLGPEAFDVNVNKNSSYNNYFHCTAIENQKNISLSVRFHENVVTEVRSIPRRTKKEYAACFYTSQELNDFLNDFVESSKNCELHCEEEFINVLQDEIDADSMYSQVFLDKSAYVKTCARKGRSYSLVTGHCTDAQNCRSIAA